MLSSPLTLSVELARLIGELDEFKGSWQALKTIAPERLAALRRVATVESVASSTRIEGVKLTDQEVEALLSNLEVKAFRSRDEEEVAGYAALMSEIFESWEHMVLSENLIKQLHGILLSKSTKDTRHRGEYKTLANHVEAYSPEGKSLGIVFETASPFDTPFQMSELVAWFREEQTTGQLHPLLQIGILIVRFLAIHPFQDGNGRLSRALTTLLLLQAGYAYVPYSSLESVIEENKDAYYLALRKTQGTLKDDAPQWEPWLLFFLRSMARQKDRLKNRIEREQILEGAMPELSVRILEIVREQGRAQTSDIETLTRQSRATIKKRLSELVARGLLIRHGKGPSTWYVLGVDASTR